MNLKSNVRGSLMSKYFVGLFIALLFAGCATHSDAPPQPNVKVFEEEDEYIMYALSAEQFQEYNAASSIYMTLYRRSGKSEYLYRSLQIENKMGNYDTVIERVNTYLAEHPDDETLMRFGIIAMLGKKEYEAAKTKALALVERTKKPQDYLIVSESYIKQKHYDTALKYLERAYAIDYDEAILDKMSIILYVNLGRKSEAIAHLETHSRLHGCSMVICNRLAGFYSEQNNLEGMLSIYLRLYEMDPLKKEYAEAIIKIYNYQKDYLKLLVFLEKSHADDPMLLQLYVNNKSYAKAAELSGKLYDKEGDITYLGQHAIFTYESARDKSDPEMLQQVMDDFKTVLQQSDDALYYNYLGYLMIDHDLDVAGGITYVKKALEIEPDSPYYKDSLGWGYYKQGKCVEAFKLIKQVEEELGNEDEEVKSHLEAIKKCLKRMK